MVYSYNASIVYMVSLCYDTISWNFQFLEIVTCVAVEFTSLLSNIEEVYMNNSTDDRRL